MDCTDKKILRILQQNARITIKQIGNEVALTPPAVAERIRRMEEDGIILGYQAKIDTRKLSKSVSAFIGVNVSPKQHDQFIKFCANNDSIIDHYRVIGNYNAMLFVSLYDSTELQILIDEIKKYGTTQTSVVLSTLFCDKPY